jgi:RHS repeat-associated protein
VATMTYGAGRQTTYQYDALDRLTQADHPAMPPPLDSLPDVENFTYDGVGDRTMAGYAHDANHRMRASPGHTYSYDDDGDVVARDPGQSGTISYQWDLDGRIMSISNGTETNFLYDPRDRRISSANSQSTKRFLWSFDSLTAAYSDAGVREVRYATAEREGLEETAFGSDRSSETLFQVYRARLGEVRLLGARDGTIRWRSVYSAYGVQFSDSDPDGDQSLTSFDLGLPGHQIDAADAPYYSYHRYYASDLGVFLSSDPVQTFTETNSHAYAMNNPTRYIDPLGLRLNAPPGSTANYDAAIQYLSQDPGMAQTISICARHQQTTMWSM